MDGVVGTVIDVLGKQGGLAGIVIAGLAYACFRLQTTLTHVQDSRTRDAQDVLPKVLALVQSQNEALAELASTITDLRRELSRQDRSD
jgi:hypothetical protein